MSDKLREANELVEWVEERWCQPPAEAPAVTPSEHKWLPDATARCCSCGWLCAGGNKSTCEAEWETHVAVENYTPDLPVSSQPMMREQALENAYNIIWKVWDRNDKDLYLADILGAIQKAGIKRTIPVSSQHDTEDGGDGHSSRLNSSSGADSTKTIANVIGFIKSAIGDCVDKAPHDAIREKLWKIVDLSYEVKRNTDASAEQIRTAECQIILDCYRQEFSDDFEHWLEQRIKF